MSKQIDEKVVEMRFDNKQFEQNVKTSMSTIEKLKQSLNFRGATKGLEGINSAAKGINLSGVGAAVDTVKVKFSALETIGVTALMNLTNQAVNTAKSVTAAFTVEPIHSGFQEYETQINAVQTILANTESKGSTLKDVNSALNELNTYADKTIYNFTEMTRNIGTFTAAGVDLNTSVSAIKGIANLAAVSGSTSQQASTAMYQLSQALAAGTVKLQDWNSVVNAGMGGQVFQDALKETARAHGIAIDQMIKDEGSFRETLSKGWLTAEVLTDTLNKFTGDMSEADLKAAGYTDEQVKGILKLGETANDAATKVKTFTQLMDTLKEAAQSGWTQTWQLIFGDFEEAKKLFTSISDTLGNFINEASNARNKFLGGALSPFSTLQNQIENAGVSMDDFKSRLLQVAKQHGLVTDEMIKKEGAFNDIMGSGKISGSIIAETLRSLIGVTTETSTAVENATEDMKQFGDIVNKVIRGDFGNGQARVEALTKAGYDYAKIQGLVNLKLLGTAKDVEKMSDAQLENMGYTKEQIKAIRELADAAEKSGTPISDMIDKLGKPSGRDLLIDSARNAFNGLIAVLKQAKKAYREVFPAKTSDQLYNLIAKINELSKGLKVNKEEASKWHDTFKGLFDLIHIFTTLTGGALRVGFKVLSAVLKASGFDLLDVTAAMGRSITKFHDFILANDKVIKVVTDLGENLWNSGKAIFDWIKSFRNLPETQANIQSFNKHFTEVMGDVKSGCLKGIEFIKGFISNVKNLDQLTLEDLQQMFKTFRETDLKTFFSYFKKGFKGLEDTVSQFGTNVKNSLKKFGIDLDDVQSKVSTFVGFLRDHLANVDLGPLLTIGIGAGLIVTASKIGKALSILAGPIQSFEKLISSFNGMINAKATVLKSEAMINMAKSVLILAAAMLVISKIDSDKLTDALIGIGLITVLLKVLSSSTGSMNKVKAFDSAKFAGTMLAISSSILVLVAALKAMQSIDDTNLMRNIGVLVGLMVTLGVVAGALGNYAPQLSKGAFTLIALSVSIKILVSAFKDLEGLDYTNFSKGITTMMTIMGGLLLMTRAASKLVGFNKAGLQVLAMVVALKLLTSSVTSIANLDVKKITDNIGAFILVFGMLAVLMITSRLAGTHSARAGIGIVAMSGSIILLSIAMRAIASMRRSDIKKSIGIISELMLVMGAVVALSNFAGKYAIRAGVMLLMMAAAIGILSIVIFALSKIDPSGLSRATLAVDSIIAMFTLLIGITSLAKDCSKTLTMVAVTLGLLAISIGALSMIPEDNLKAATKTILSVMAMFAVLIAVTSLAKSATSSIIAIGILVALLSGALVGLSLLPLDNVLPVAQALSLLILSLSASCLLISLVPVSGALTGIASLAIVIAGIGLILAALAGLSKIEGFNEFMSSGIDTLGIIGNAIGTFVGSIAGGFAEGMMDSLPSIGKSLSGFIKELEPFLTGVKSIDGEVMTGVLKLAEAIVILSAANFVNGISKLFGAGNPFKNASDGLEDFGKAISKFSSAVTGNVSPKGVEKACKAGKAIAEMAKALPNSGGFLGKILGNNDMSIVGPQLEDFAIAIRDFSNVVSKKGAINLKAIKSATKAGVLISDMANELPNQGGLAAFFAGDNKLSTIGSQLKDFATAICDFSNVVSEKGAIKLDAITDAVEAADLISDMANNLPNSFGIVSLFTGDNTMTGFGIGLVNLGRCIKKFSDEIKGLSVDSIAHVMVVTDVMNQLVKMAKDIPDSGGLKTLFTGDNDISKFGGKLELFGTRFSAFASNLKGIKADTVNETVSATTEMAKLTTLLPKKKESENISLDKFGQLLSKFGFSFSGFYKNIKDVDGTNLSGVANSMLSFVTLFQRINNTEFGNIVPFIDALDQLGNAGVDQFIKAFNDSNGKIQGAATSLTQAFIRGIQSKQIEITKAFGDIATESLKQFTTKQFAATSAGAKTVSDLADGVRNNSHLAKSAISSMLIKTISTIRTKEPEFKARGESILNQFVIGISSRSSNISNSFTEALRRAGSNIQSWYNSFYNYGSYLVSGFANGISDNQYRASAQAALMASNAAAAAKSALKIASPSKVFYGIGKFTGMGFVNALSDYAKNAYSAGSNIADSARRGLSTTLSAVTSMLDLDLDSTPTIRPVLDLSGISEGTSALNGMLDLQKTLSLGANVSAVAGAPDQFGQNGTNEMLNAINGLKQTLNNASGDTYNVGGITYDDGSNVSEAVRALVKAARMERRV